MYCVVAATGSYQAEAFFAVADDWSAVMASYRGS
jgi:hypothetical protein